MKLHHPEPDGNRFLPHHHYLGMGIAFTAGISSSQPWAMEVLFGTIIGTYAFALLWHGAYAEYGSAISIASGVLVVGAGLYGFAQGAGWPALVAVLGGLVALDDTIQHATGWWMPLDWFWKEHLRPRI